MKKEYKNLVTLIKKFGLEEAISHKFLEFRDKHPLANRLFPKLIIGHLDSSAYSPSYIAKWNPMGKLIYFNPNPEYPRDFIPINLNPSDY